MPTKTGTHRATLTPLGKFLAVLRVYRDQTQHEMAALIGVSQSELSNISRGHALMDAHIADRVVAEYRLNEDRCAELRRLLDEQPRTWDSRHIAAAESPLSRDTLLLLERRFATLNEEQLTRLRAILAEA